MTSPPPVGTLTGWSSICGQNTELYWKMVINPWINRDLYTHCKHQWNWFQGKKRKFLIFRGKILGFRWRCSLICQAIESLDSYGPLSSPPIEVTTAWHSCDLVQAASPHTLLWLEWTPRWTPIPHGFPNGSPCFFLEMVIFGNHFWRLFGQNHAIDELHYLPLFTYIWVICG